MAERVRQWLAKLPGKQGRILVLAGKGHNGDDARRTAEHLAGLSVQLYNVTDPEKALPEVISQLELKPALIVDGLFGIGIDRPLDEKWKALIERVNDSRIPVLALDVPSGLNADTGAAEGAAIRAAVTLTLGAPKQGMLLPAAWPYVGRLEVAPDIGMGKCPESSELNWTLPEDFCHFPPARSNAANKGDFGRLAILAGSMGYHGAAVLTARGAQRAHPGLITLHTLEPVYHVVASQLQAVMVNAWQPALKLPGNYNAILIGPGLAAEDVPDGIKLATRQLWRDGPVALIVDASALDWVPLAAPRSPALRLITPHPGEAARLLRTSAQNVQANRTNALRELSKRLGNCWVALKGAQTLVGRSTGEIFVNSSGNPNLAQGGSGDVLSGYLAALLAQSPLLADPRKTICYGVWQHGAAADRLNETRQNWVVEDLAGELGAC